jgi:membrane associated rhomboid family serine protease
MVGTFAEEIKSKFREGDFVWSIIVVCGAVFVLQHTLSLIGLSLGNAALTDIATPFFALPLSLSGFIHKPWTVFTNIFFHRGLGHIFSNLLMLFWFGQIYQLYLNNKYGWKIFIGGGVFGGLLALLAYQVVPFLKGAAAFSNLAGASGGVEAIVFAVTAINPEHEINLLVIGRVKLKYIALFSLLLNYLGIAGGNSAGVIAHLGGAAFGYFYMRQIQEGRDVLAFSTAFKKLFQRKPKMKVVHVNMQERKPVIPHAPTDKTQERLDAILDKIGQSGYDSLSKAEKDFLFQYGNNE